MDVHLNPRVLGGYCRFGRDIRGVLRGACRIRDVHCVGVYAQKVLVGHIVLNLVSQCLFVAAVVMLFAKVEELAKSMTKGVFALLIWMTHSVVLSVLTMTI